MKIYYRLSDHGYQKVKPDYINNEKCLTNLMLNFTDTYSDTVIRDELIVIADNVGDETYEWLSSLDLNVKRTDFGSGAQSFNYVLDEAVKLDDDTTVYFVEDDYLHLPNSRKILKEGISLGADYVSLYDHPDKYINKNEGGNPYVEDGGEVTKVFRSESCHWKLTNSTTMTFASKVKTLKEDLGIMKTWTIGTYPDDFKMFLELRENGRTLITPLPGYSTHGETQWLSPFTDWRKV
tara:strand:- start:859 stop:1566 length:708 start_codon:yes stop_codon:yes gene_type:complete